MAKWYKVIMTMSEITELIELLEDGVPTNLVSVLDTLRETQTRYRGDDND